ncbi:pps1 dual specificty phosphatase [Paecilomyces variotii No. 5]|uniref:Pps1 dual specificty phosphatase n=1 Tax=Byssochlamys spectabilis (strain No. 5 / NBRC 109023) TaxID=1356009 RepID=V5FYE5_BYSSN|nr:pps1 dual specificty phosphatase [Paecilomyces variotii No. 5]
MATVVVQQQSIRHSSTPPPLSPALSLNAGIRTPTPVPNKHLPICPTGPAPLVKDIDRSKTGVSGQLTSALYPPDGFDKLSDSPPIYSIDVDTLKEALDHLSTQPLPEPKHVFPWLHGLHPNNQIQLAFFANRKKSVRRAPRCLRGMTIVKVGGDLSKARIKGAVSPGEVLAVTSSDFLEADPAEGFSVRNFQIQTAKMASLSDIVVYGDDNVPEAETIALAEQIALAQQNWRLRNDPAQETPLYNTFVLSSTFREVEERHPDLISVDRRGHLTGRVMDFFQWERLEMCSMSKASEISKNVWQGPTPDLAAGLEEFQTAHEDYDLFIEASDLASIPGPRFLARVDRQLKDGPQQIEFPSSGSIVPPPTTENREVDDLITTVRWLYYLANPEEPEEPDDEVDADGDIQMASMTHKPRKILIHCGDGYTESSLLALAYFMFAEGVPAHEAWLRLHCDKKRNFFAYPSDVAFLTTIQQRLLQESPAAQGLNVSRLADPAWLGKMDGSLPSRILPYMYLGNLTHANNPELLWALGIRRVLSIGEPVAWSEAEVRRWGKNNLMFIDQVQDNGIDPLTQEFDRCLEFIRKGKSDGGATLVHCRVGVSRSATICIAEVMASLDLTFPRAYCFVRARRLNVIIQPHLRFVYELLKWEELQRTQRNRPLRRELEWATVAREIALMNKPYSRQ